MKSEVNLFLKEKEYDVYTKVSQSLCTTTLNF